MAKVLLMGGTGWLGHLVGAALSRGGYEVTILSRGKKMEFAENPLGLRTICADKSDEAAMKEVLSTRYHYIIDTVPKTDSLELVRKYATGLTHYVHCSSTGGYAPLPFVPCDETAPYGGFRKGTGWAGKREVDALALDYFHREGFPATVIRPCYISGPGKLPLDNYGGRRADYIPDVFHEKALEVPNDGRALLQPVRVQDLAESFVLALAQPRSIGEIYNICSDHAMTLDRYHEVTAEAFGKKPNLVHVEMEALLQKHGAAIEDAGLRFLCCHMCFTNAKARRDLGYVPSLTPEEIVEECALWTAKQAGLV